MFMLVFILVGLAAAVAIARYGLPLWFAASLGSAKAPTTPALLHAGDKSVLPAACRAMSRGVLTRILHERGGWVKSCQASRSSERLPIIEGAAFAHAALQLPSWRAPASPIPAAQRRGWSWPVHFGLGMWSAARYGRNFEEVLRLAQCTDAWFRYLCLDGYGFKHGLLDFTRHRSAIAHFHAIPGYYRRAAFQGFGRALYLTHPGNRAGLFETIGDTAPEHDVDMIEGVAFGSAYYQPHEPIRAINMARAVPYEWRPHAHLGLVLGYRVIGMMDAELLNSVLLTLPQAGMDAIRQGIRICDEAEDRIRAEHPVSGYGLWRETIIQRIEHDRVLEPLYLEELSEGRRGNRGLVS